MASAGSWFVMATRLASAVCWLSLSSAASSLPAMAAASSESRSEDQAGFRGMGTMRMPGQVRHRPSSIPSKFNTVQVQHCRSSSMRSKGLFFEGWGCIRFRESRARAERVTVQLWYESEPWLLYRAYL